MRGGSGHARRAGPEDQQATETYEQTSSIPGNVHSPVSSDRPNTRAVNSDIAGDHRRGRIPIFKVNILVRNV